MIRDMSFDDTEDDFFDVMSGWRVYLMPEGNKVWYWNERLQEASFIPKGKWI